MVAGGQGAPLVPLLDFVMFRHRTRGRVLQNLGGIGNLTAIPPNAQRWPRSLLSTPVPPTCSSMR
jgi:1,6-anhydro-N-acetylmuramate kinase